MLDTKAQVFCALNDKARAAYGTDPIGYADASTRTVTAGLQSSLAEFRQAAITPVPAGPTGDAQQLNNFRQMCERYGWVGNP